MLVLLLPFLINIFFYAQSETVLTTEVREHNISNLRSKSIQIDNAVDKLMETAFNVYYSTTADEIANYPEGAFDSKNRYNALSMCEILKDYETDIPHIRKMFFYFNSIDEVVTSSGIYKAEETHISELGEEYEEKWKDMLRQRAVSSFVKIGENPGRIYFVYSDTNHIQYRKNLIIEVDFDEIMLPLTSEGDVFVEGMAVISPDGKVISRYGNENLGKILDTANIAEGKGEYHVSLDKKDYMVIAEKSEKNNLTYAYVTVENAFYETVQRSKTLNIISLVICVLLGFGIIYVSLRKNYDPIRDLLKLLNEESDGAYANENEFDYVNKAISDIIVKKKEFTNRLSAQEPILRSNILRQILKGNTNNLPVADILDSLNINFRYDYFAVMVFYIENKDEMFFDGGNDSYPENKNKALANYAVINVMEELLSSENCSVTPSEEDYVLTLILNVKNNSPETENFIHTKLQEGKTLLEEKCNLYYTVGVSDIHTDTDGIALGYSEAMRCVEQRFLLKKEETIFFKDLSPNETVGYYFPLDVEQKLIYCLKAGEFDGCGEILDHIYKVNIEERKIDLELAKCLMHDIMGAVVKSFSEIYSDAEKISGIGRMFEYVLGSATANEMMDKIKIVFETVCNDVRRIPVDSSVNVITKIDEYLNERYCDPTLNVTSVAEHFGMNTTYLSNMYKKKKGIGLLEYITTIRVEKAKEILTNEPSVTLEALGERVGIGNVRTLSRVFTKHTGVSPGKFKEVSGKEKNK